MRTTRGGGEGGIVITQLISFYFPTKSNRSQARQYVTSTVNIITHGYCCNCFFGRCKTQRRHIFCFQPYINIFTSSVHGSTQQPLTGVLLHTEDSSQRESSLCFNGIHTRYNSLLEMLQLLSKGGHRLFPVSRTKQTSTNCI